MGDERTRHDDDQVAPLEASRHGHTVRLSGTARDLEELGQAAAAASAAEGVQEVDVGDVHVEVPDTGLYE